MLGIFIGNNYEKMRGNRFFLSNVISNGGLISKSFSLWLQSPKNGANLFPQRKDAQERNLTPVLETGAKVKYFLKSSYLLVESGYYSRKYSRLIITEYTFT